ncbi:hypothetical protein [Actinobaculum sp. 352]|uniref:hypothetical protein n=1 Tax=Actinobaculum sp. 352 TaxID=2490946 RepID=UPI000F7E6066|nr:hypothetical protein [Actinobaculum sp. 352]RTE49337.1 hypothetical protein EKN07_07155 [Actinobaculum sp. 352]
MSKTQTTYRKTKSGEWVAYGRYSELMHTEGKEISIHKKDGSTTTRVCRKIGKPFRVDDGAEMVYAYLEGGERIPRWSGPCCDVCGSTRGVHEAFDLSGIGGYACYQCDDGFLSFA